MLYAFAISFISISPLESLISFFSTTNMGFGYVGKGSPYFLWKSSLNSYLAYSLPLQRMLHLALRVLSLQHTQIHFSIPSDVC